jgi:hypothetical protein
MAKRGPKRNKHQKARDIRQESKLRAEGHTLHQIAEAVGVSHEQVRLDLKYIDQRLIEAAAKDLEKAKAENLAKLRFAQAEVLEAWKLSLEDSERISTKQSADGTETTTVTEGQSGNPGHLRNYIRALEAEAKLLGLYEMGTGKGDEAAQRLLELHEQLELARKLYDTQETPPAQS